MGFNTTVSVLWIVVLIAVWIYMTKKGYSLPSTVVTFIVMAVAYVVVICTSSEGIIEVEGYPHAVHICGDCTVVNAGHAFDPEIDLLLKVAEKECGDLLGHPYKP